MPNTGKIYREFPGIEYWWDYTVKTWYAMRVDADGNQVGNTIDAYRKPSILKMIREGYLDSPTPSEF